MDNNKAWEYALGMIKVDGLEPSKEYLELIEKEKRGEITTDDIRKVLDKKYKAKGSNLYERSISISKYWSISKQIWY